ncbi:hypothetical protein [Streptomyces sp. AC555_RSS877]|uniref:hypothetical protein n=1 Tax=Streptomyces sp. AC555_RSS877 TaxID=2823688 RepID=UPI001C258F1D|nr:hypothetical protein [Streptomyces sp. AC555_RSS877]
MSGDHLITDDETRQIAEGFLEASPWLGDVTWQRIIVGPAASLLVELREMSSGEDDELPAGNRWSWKVNFSDPSGERTHLTHEKVLKGLNEIVYGDHEGAKGWGFLKVQQWYVEPTQERQRLTLSTGDKSSICQYGLYGKTVFPTGKESSLGGDKLDFFKEQRSAITSETDSE